MLPVRVLSCHAAYRCRRRGACCSADWPIPVETDRLARIRAAIENGVLRPAPAAGDAGCFESGGGEAPPETPARLRIVDRRCVFFETGHGSACLVHEALGHDALPLACRQFPRVVLTDPRGVSVTLSHYCPTAAALLDEESPVRIVESPAAFPASGEYVGLDARASLPPLLRPDMLMDWESWWELERLAVDLLANSQLPAAEALGCLRAIVERLRPWNPGDGSLIDRVRQTFLEPPAPMTYRTADLEARCEEVMTAVPEAIRTGECSGLTGPAPADAASPGSIKRFLAAHAFANWTAHLGLGVRSWLRSIEAAFAVVVSGRDTRQADLLLRHLADPRELAEGWSREESGRAANAVGRIGRAGRTSRS